MCSCSVSQTKVTQHTQGKKLFRPLRRSLLAYSCNFIRMLEAPIEGYAVNRLWQFVLKIEKNLKNNSLHLLNRLPCSTSWENLCFSLLVKTNERMKMMVREWNDRKNQPISSGGSINIELLSGDHSSSASWYRWSKQLNILAVFSSHSNT